MKITERVRMLSQSDFNSLVDSFLRQNFDIASKYFSQSQIRRLRPIYNALNKFAKNTGAIIRKRCLEDIREDLSYCEESALFIAVMDNLQGVSEITGRDLYNTLGKGWVYGFADFQCKLYGLSYCFKLFYYTDTNGLDLITINSNTRNCF